MVFEITTGQELADYLLRAWRKRGEVNLAASLKDAERRAAKPNASEIEKEAATILRAMAPTQTGEG